MPAGKFTAIKEKLHYQLNFYFLEAMGTKRSNKKKMNIRSLDPHTPSGVDMGMILEPLL